MGQDVVDIGQSVIFKGELSAKQDLTVDGSVEGKIELAQHVLTIGAKGRIKAQVVAKVVIVMGNVDGNITATEKIDIHEKATVNGDLIPTIFSSRQSTARERVNPNWSNPVPTRSPASVSCVASIPTWRSWT